MKFRSMMARTSRSTSGCMPMKRRRGMRILLPTRLSAMARKNSASAESWRLRFVCRCVPSLPAGDGVGGFVVAVPEVALHAGCHLDVAPVLVDEGIVFGGVEGDGVCVHLRADGAAQGAGVGEDGLSVVALLALPPLVEECLAGEIAVELLEHLHADVGEGVAQGGAELGGEVGGHGRFGDLDDYC